MIALILVLSIAWTVVLCFCAYIDAAQQGEEWEDDEQ